MQQSEINTIIQLTSSNSLVLHLRDRQEVELNKSAIILEEDICHAENLYVPCNEVLYITVPKVYTPIVASVPPKQEQGKPLSNKMILWQELESCGYVAMYSGRVIHREDVENGDLITIEHIVPTAKGGTNDLDNLTLEYKDINTKKGCMLPMDFVKTLKRSEQRRYNRTVTELYIKGIISKTKYRNYMRTKS